MEVDHRIIKWKIFGYVIGCIGIGINLAYLDGFGRKIVDQWEFILIDINFIVSISWIAGFVLSRSVFLLPLLLWFTLIFAVWMMSVVLLVVSRVADLIEESQTENAGFSSFTVITGLIIVVYILTVLSYVKFKKANKNSGMGVEYTSAPAQNLRYPNIE